MVKHSMRVGWGALAGLLFGVSAVTGVMVAKEVELVFFPVVSRAVITESIVDSDSVTIWGTFDKMRDCRFIEANASAGRLELDLEFKDERKYRATTRAIGPQVFGPWRISPSLAPLRIVARHECHPLWFTSTVLVEGYKP